MENRSSNENWEILNAAGRCLSLQLDAMTGDFEFHSFDPLDPFGLDGDRKSPRHFRLSMTKEIARLGEAWADLNIANKRALAAKKRLLRLALPLIAAWGYDAINPGPAGFHFISFLDGQEAEAEMDDEHSRFRHIVKDCPIDKAMDRIIAANAELSAEKERRALAAFTPASPTPASRNGWL